VKKNRLRVVENRVLLKIFGAVRDEISVEWRRLLKEELCVMHSSSNAIRMIN
jgi:hypothetical protein